MPNKRAAGQVTPNISVDAALWDAAKAKAASEGRPLSEVIRELLREWLGPQQ
jgi:hypothetical protein